MNVQQLSQFSADQKMSPEKKQYFQVLDHIVRQMPGFVALKTPASVYASANLLCANLAGYQSIDSYVGTTDYEWKCDAVSLADKIRAQDKLVMESKQNWSSFNVVGFSLGRTYYFSNKSVIYFPDGEILGVLFVGTMLTDVQVLKTLNTLIKIDPRQSSGAIEASVYATDKKANPFNLSVREEECLFYLIRGKSAKEIARFLNISPRTVETHVEQIKHKFHCSLRSEIFSIAIETGYFYYIPSSLLKSGGILQALL